MQDPERFLSELEIALPCVVADNGAAVINADHRSHVNWEIFFFSNEERKSMFDEDPIRYCGLITDPVSKERFQPTEASPRFDYRGRPYFFASQATVGSFKSMPDALANPHHKMKKKPDQ